MGQVEAKRTGQVYWIRAAFCLVIGLIFLGVFAVRPLVSRGLASPEPTPTSTVVAATPSVAAPTATQSSAAPAVTTPTSLPPSPSPAETAEPTATLAPVTATVSSGVGVWLRGAPSTAGEQLEWLLDGSIVTLLAGVETADGLEWQQVRTEGGVEGWVARDFLSVAAP